MNNICFVGNFYKTGVYEAIAEILRSKKGTDVFWILSNEDQYREYAEKYGIDHTLLIDRTVISYDAKPIADLKINEIVFNDRIWKYDKEQGIQYLRSIQKPVYEFLKSNHIQTVFGENTLSEELLICRMCHQLPALSCDYFSYMTSRIPGDRFFFFIDERQAEPWQPEKRDEKPSIVIEIKKPEYLAKNDMILKKKMSFSGLWKRFKYFITDEHISRTDPNVLTDKRTRFRVKSKEVLNQQRYRFVKRCAPSILDGKKYVFYGFHVQPESSVDVCGRYNEDQKMVVENIWRQLPDDWYLVIKEHSNGIGNRDPQFFKYLQALPRVILVNESADSKPIIANAQMVITNTGTMALEAALMGVPSVTLSKAVFNGISYCKHLTWEDFEKIGSLAEYVEIVRSQPVDISGYIDVLERCSFKGRMGDLFGSPHFLEDVENLQCLADAFWALITRNEA